MSTISPQARQELVTAVAERYQRSTPAERGRILDEFVALTGYHRKHAIRVLNGSSAVSTVRRGRRSVIRRSRDRGAGRAVGGIGPRVREASEGVAADPGAGTRAARARDPGPAGTQATDGGERRHDRPPPGVREGGDGPVSAGAGVPGATAYGAGFRCARSGIGRIRRRASSRPISSRTVDRRWLAASSGRWC